MSRAKLQLLAAGKGIELLHMMSKHLSCKPLDLDKICQNMTQKLIERQLFKEAHASTEGMLVRIDRFISAGVGAGKATAVRKYGSVNKENNAKAAAEDWRGALNNILAASGDTGRKADADECAMVMGCLSNLASLAFPDEPLDRICGLDYLRWARTLTTVDADMSTRLCGSMYKASTRAASAADALAKSAKPGSKEHAQHCASAVSIRCYSVRALPSLTLGRAGDLTTTPQMVYLALSGRMKLAEVVQQAVKAAKFYEKTPGAATTIIQYAPSPPPGSTPAIVIC